MQYLILCNDFGVRLVFEKTIQIKVDELEVVIALSSDGVSRGGEFVIGRWNKLHNSFLQILLKKYSPEFKNNEKWYGFLTIIMSWKSICGYILLFNLSKINTRIEPISRMN
jgi:hypothetical protein